MVNLFVWCTIFAIAGWITGWYTRSVAEYLKRAVQEVPQTRVKWRILEIHYKDPNRTTEHYRFLRSREYDVWDEAMKEANKSHDEDTLKNNFRTEYVVVEAP